MEETIATTEPQPFRGEDWFDPLEGAVRERIRGFIEEMLEGELDAALQRRRYDRRGPAHGHRHGHRERHLIGTFGPVTVSVPRARLAGVDGRTSEWRNRTIPSYKRLTKRAEALIAATYLAGTNTRRVRRALAALFGGAIGKDIVSRAWHKVQTDWDAWQERDLSKDDIVRLILDGTVVRVRLDKRATGLSLLVALGVRRDGQKVLLGLKNMGGESEASWSVCMRNSSGASRLSACCRAPPPRACCFGRCSPAAKSAYVASTAGTRFISHLVSRILNSRLELTNIADRRCAVSFSYQLRDATERAHNERSSAHLVAGLGRAEGLSMKCYTCYFLTVDGRVGGTQ